MSAPTTHDPRFVNTRDGVCWERRAVTDSGLGLYAVEGSCKCPEFKMATFVELAAHGIVEWADVLPMPVGPVPQLSVAEQVSAEIARFGIFGAALPATKALVKRADELVTENAGLRAQVAALLDERHSTNESVSEADEALRVQRDRIAELETGIAWRDAERDRWAGVRYLVEKAIDKGWSSVDRFDLEDVLGPEVAPVLAEPVAEPSCLCPPADQPGPHQVGCPLAEVPRPSERPVNELTSAFSPAAALREVLDGEHYAYVHHEHRTPHDLPELGGTS